VISSAQAYGGIRLHHVEGLKQSQFMKIMHRREVILPTKSEMSIENEGGWALRHPVVVCCVQVIILSVLLFLLAKNAAALGYHGYHIIEDIMVSASDITLAEDCWVERWGAISGCRREGMVWLLTVWWSGYPKAPAW